jgi:hypothetical protein
VNERHLCMQVHAYTFRNEDKSIRWTWAQDPFAEIYAFVEEGVDGLFTDFPDTAIAAVERAQQADVAPLQAPARRGSRIIESSATACAKCF